MVTRNTLTLLSFLPILQLLIFDMSCEKCEKQQDGPESLIRYVKRMRIAVEASRQNLSYTNEKIASLKSNLDDVSKIKGVQSLDASGSFVASSSESSEVISTEDVHACIIALDFKSAVPLDVHSYMLEFLVPIEVGQLEICSSKIKDMIIQSEYWINLRKKCVVKYNMESNENVRLYLRDSIIRIGLKRRKVLQIIEVMKEQVSYASGKLSVSDGWGVLGQLG